MKRLLVTCEFPPMTGGQASYFAGLWTPVLNTDHFLAVPSLCRGQGVTIDKQQYRYLFLPVGENWISRFIRLGVLVSCVGYHAIRMRPAEIHFGQFVVGGLCGMVIWWFLRIPYVVHCHGADILEFSRYRWMRWCMKFMVSRSRLIIANSTFTARCVRTLYDSAAGVAVVNPSVGSDCFVKDNSDVDQIRKRHGLGDEPVVICAGRLVERKGHDVIIESMAMVKSKMTAVRCFIVGDGPRRRHLEDMTSKLCLESTITFCGRVTRKELIAYYHIGSIFVLVPRLLHEAGDVEGFGIVYLEANAAGLPVIASRSGGIEDAVNHRVSGVLVDDPLNSRCVADAIADMLIDKKHRDRLSANAVEHAKKYLPRQQRQKWIEAIGG